MPMPTTDPTSIFEHFRGSYGTELLTAAVSAFDVFGKLAKGPCPRNLFREQLGIDERPFCVLTTTLRAMKLLDVDSSGSIKLTPLAEEHLIPDRPFFVGDYVGLAAESPGVREMVTRLKTNRPVGGNDDRGAAFIFREGLESAMEKEASARHLTLALAGRAKNVAPHVAARVPLSEAKVLLDIGGGTGIYSIECLRVNPKLHAIIWDRPEVLKIAKEFALAAGLTERMTFVAGDMFLDPIPGGADVWLLSNILHDWDVPECRKLLRRCAETMRSGDRLWIHDVFLNDALDGPLPIALYSAALFTLTEGRAYSAAEYRGWLRECGLTPGEIIPTLIHCGVLPATKG